MARIAFILLCHKDPDAVIAQARRLVSAGDYVAIHFDARAPEVDFTAIHAALQDSPNVVFARRRIKCGWGEWSLVAATLEALRAAVTTWPDATHFYMVSGDCMPIKTAEYAHAFLDQRDCDYIEAVDFFTSGWIRTGMQEDRLYYRHWFNEREQKRLFYASLGVQRALKLAREVPEGIKVHIGSQWWCLRRATVETLLAFCAERPDVVRFFSTTWIPDETFFQTLVRHLIPEAEIESRTPTFLMFSDYGMPVTFYNDHYDLLLGQDFLFARKISAEAQELKDRLGALWAETGRSFAISGEGKRLHAFLTGQGRVGRRYVPRFWEAEGSLGRERELLLIACKKWHVAKRVLARAQEELDVQGVAFAFHEEDCVLPDLGGIEKTLQKRARHRRALVRMLFDYYQTDRLALCIDPSAIDLMQDFFTDRSRTKLLEIECGFSDSYLIGHARRVGLASDHSPDTVLRELVPTIRAEIAFERERIRDAGFSEVYRMSESHSAETNAVALAGFFGVPEIRAESLARTDHLFTD
ncbi:glycosyl transferase family 14 [Dinoroseobacter shibae DFL 12 = DSM 16493]|uniref:Peptide O-xylosyltransferase n=1 Tax=Dinoroseobacter shibae (strain DSM 16493 / NCIMB 14021 / DFL 12) TaxID=398580 RepID=A8LQD8_DINSH|nr:DUF5928 domain-containing protein [Dinoroseobacter shibae]ABV92424.1 glycosyl transferase family 14 [Dinoroseobacter shibae DFL 12 = DSM 16493]URF47369.1 beta-1,6-N-acetylglucosaminyltransferase [Dinoroseobacter shibae]URF51680.1 beta-1,6-N-acetylglucosaminyltransferase [Dinoroseobacter shibae]